MKNIFKSFLLGFKYAFNGIFETIKTERNIKIHIFIMIIVILFGIFLKISLYEWIVCIILFSVVISAEIMNTSIEHIVDGLMPNENEYARKAKDAAAGAVLVLAIGAAIIGLIIFIPKLLLFL